jgi:hypothetical protein
VVEQGQIVKQEEQKAAEAMAAVVYVCVGVEVNAEK